MTAILGISALHHESAAALVVDGVVAGAELERRFTGRRQDRAFPLRAIEFCLVEAGLRIQDLDYVGFCGKPIVELDRRIETSLDAAPKGFRTFKDSTLPWMSQLLPFLRQMRTVLKSAYDKGVVYAEIFESHAAGSFFTSPFDEAAILMLGGAAEWATASLGAGRGNKIELTHETRFPHSLGLLVAAFNGYCGLPGAAGAGGAGEPAQADRILGELMDLKDDGSFRLDLSYFDCSEGQLAPTEAFHRLFGGGPRPTTAPLDKRTLDLMASVQHASGEIMARSARHAHRVTGLSNLCLGGDVAIPDGVEERIRQDGTFQRIWTPPGPTETGGALGVALFVWYSLLESPRAVAEVRPAASPGRVAT